ncbi:hypothetical protein LCGC14_0383340 [marine sediment metagenome]|uniref:Uncharacterized protein n=1 Tax=marine sediment metagenome TaxID=412755 RepID=A0A0F9T1K2_9ZZZZ
MGRKPVNPPPLTLKETTKIDRQPLYTHRIVTCIKCNQSGGILIKVGDNEYVHQNQSGCNK